ncbi:hypothetical protein SteCoe_24759 [Stentor coeruleus]|uniref:Uncharacterized protein n=1 Tax=Stentor coeruleus TaxID=5963 RepID=A0A1R2BGU0_9CILI|nr:hypothetical protein SteCoe_24759 [Stentor coeruleus]
MCAMKAYLNHIGYLEKRIAILETNQQDFIPKDLFQKLRFKEFRLGKDNELEFIEMQKNRTENESKYEITE